MNKLLLVGLFASIFIVSTYAFTITNIGSTNNIDSESNNTNVTLTSVKTCNGTCAGTCPNANTGSCSGSCGKTCPNAASGTCTHNTN